MLTAILAHPADGGARSRPLRQASWLAAALLALPMVQPVHLPPMVSIESQWLAVALGLALATRVAASDWAGWPRIAWAPLAVAGWVAVQPAVVPMPYPQVALLPALLAVWAALLLAAGHGLRQASGGSPALWDTLAAAVLAAGLFNSALAVAQVAAPGHLPGWLAYEDDRTAHAAAGNLRHQGHLALQLGLALAAALWLHQRRRLAVPAAGLAVLLLAVGTALTTQRAALVYAAVPLALAALQRRRASAGASHRKGTVLAAALALAAVGLAAWLVPMAVAAVTQGPAGGALVRGSHDGGFWIRLPIWHSAWVAFASAPLAGVGVDGYTAFHLSRAAGLPDFRYTVHAHNVPLHLLATLGLMGTAPLAWMLWTWMRAWRANRPAAPASLPMHWLAMAGLCALVETPTGVAHLLGPVALLTGLTFSGRSAAIPRPVARALPWWVAGVGALALASAAWAFLRLGSPWWQPMSSTEMRERFEAAGRHPMTAAVADSVRADFLGLAHAASPGMLPLVQRVAAWRPAERPLYRLAAVLAVHGRPADARAVLAQAMRAFPRGREPFVRHACRSPVAGHPGLQALLRVAVQPAADRGSPTGGQGAAATVHEPVCDLPVAAVPFLADSGEVK